MTAESGFYEKRDSTLVTGLSLKVRTRVYQLFERRFGEAASVIDVGVTSEQRSPEANFFEKLFPHKDRITAAGIEDASFLEGLYPGLKFRRIEAGAPLPFADGQFEVAFSHAVIEHIVDPEQRRFFVAELLRVARAAFITTPNKYFWVEPHTSIPFLHFAAPGLFYRLLESKLVHKFYDRSNLALLSRTDLQALARTFPEVDAELERVRLFGVTSNLVLTLTRRQGAGARPG